MGNVQSEPSAGGGSRKQRAPDRSSETLRTSLVEREVTPASSATLLARGLGVRFPGSSAAPGLLVPPEPQASPSPLTLELPSPMTPPSEEATAAAVSTPSPSPVGPLLPAPSQWRKPTGIRVPRIHSLLKASHRGQGDPPSLRPLPPPPCQLTEEDPNHAPRAPSPTPPPLEPREQPPPPPSDRQPPNLRTTPALATPTATPAENQVRHSSDGLTVDGARRGPPPQAGEVVKARPSASESGQSLLRKVTFKSGTPLPAGAASSSSLAAKASLGGSRGGGLFAAASGSISYAEVLKQGPLAPGAARPSGEVPRGAREAKGGDGDGEGGSGPPSAPASQARTFPPPPYTIFPGLKPKFDWVRPPHGPEQHFRFKGADGALRAPRRRAVALSGPRGSPLSPPGRMQPYTGPRKPAPALLAPPMFIFPAPTSSEPVSPRPPGPQELAPPLPTPLPVVLPATPVPGRLESAPAPAPVPALPLALAADQAHAPARAPASTLAKPQPPAPTPIKARTRRNKGSRAARGKTREDGAPGDGPRERTASTVTDRGSRGGGGGAPPAATAKIGTTRHWPPFQVLNSCPCKCYCRHQPRHRRLPRNVSAWLSTPTNHLSEPPWVATIKLAGSLVAGLEHYDLQDTHSN